MSMKQPNELEMQANAELQAGNIDGAITLFDEALVVMSSDDEMIVAAKRDTYFKRFAPVAMQLGDLGALTRGLNLVRENIAVYERLGQTDELGKARNNLGVLLFQIASSLPVDEGRVMADEGIAALEAAATTRTIEKEPLEFAQTQSNLATAFQAHPDITLPGRSEKLLDRAIEAYENALSVFTVDDHPGPWAQALTNLGSSLAERGLSAPSNTAVDFYRRSVSALEQAKMVFTKETQPNEWSTIRNNQGIALRRHCIIATENQKTSLLNDSIAAHRDAVSVIEPQSDPLGWMKSHHGYALVLEEAAKHEVAEKKKAMLLQALEYLEIAAASSVTPSDNPHPEDIHLAIARVKTAQADRQ